MQKRIAQFSFLMICANIGLPPIWATQDRTCVESAVVAARRYAPFVSTVLTLGSLLYTQYVENSLNSIIEQQRITSQADSVALRQKINELNDHIAHLHRCDPNFYNADKFVALAAEGNNDALACLLKNGVNVDARNQSTGRTALIEASKAGHYSTVKLLLDYKPEVNLKDPSDRTALIYAIQNNYGDIVKLLLDAQADPTIKSNGFSARFWVTYPSMAEIIDDALNKLTQAKLNQNFDDINDIDDIDDSYPDGESWNPSFNGYDD